MDVTKMSGQVRRFSPKDAPPGAILLTEQQRLRLLYKKIKENGMKYWSLNYGPSILAGVTLLSSSMILKHMRRFVKLGSNGVVLAVTGTAIMPSFVNLMSQNFYVTDDILIYEKPCHMCYMMRASLIQLTTGVFYPLVLGPMGSLILAQKYQSCATPPLSSPKSVMEFVRTGYKPFTGFLTILVAVSLAMAVLVTYLELKSSNKLVEDLLSS